MALKSVRPDMASEGQQRVNLWFWNLRNFFVVFIYLSNFASTFTNSCFFSLKQKLPQHPSHEAVSLPSSLLSTSWPTANLTADRYSISDSWPRANLTADRDGLSDSWQRQLIIWHPADCELTHSCQPADTQVTQCQKTADRQLICHLTVSWSDSWQSADLTADSQLIWQLTVSWSDSWQ